MTPTKKPVTKRFRVLLEQYESSSATGFKLPFDALKTFGTRARMPVCGTINGFPYRSSIFPTGAGSHYMVVNKEIRTGAQAQGGMMISVVMQRDDAPRIVTPPPDLARALKANKQAQARWAELSYTHQKEHARAVAEAKRPETRQRRIEHAIAQLVAGHKSKA